ncbi:uncharacterized protein [Spinacia oleracea]|uniref:Retrotransposon gag domain-containing protein n=1 Tax=Spinacia oleracea TaxID=3562 RepID=A0ABM3QY74_SPIOL|nr:uncharacterized protein LOC110806146 [Spinacia oleracea]
MAPRRILVPARLDPGPSRKAPTARPDHPREIELSDTGSTPVMDDAPLASLSRRPARTTMSQVDSGRRRPFQERSQDPICHIQQWEAGTTEATWCKYFPATLKGVASKLFEKLPAGTINTLAKLEMLFLTRFMAYKEEKKTSMHLGRILQGKDESLRSYVRRFNLESGQIPDLPDGVAFDNFFRGLKKGYFKFNLVKKSVRTMADALDEVELFIHATEFCSAPKELKGTETSNNHHRKDKSDKKSARPNETWAIESKGYRPNSSPGQKRGRPYEKEKFEYNNTDLYTILLDISNKHDIDRPFPMKSPVETRDSTLYCKFHCDVGHDTKDCKSLRRALDGLASKGFLKSYLCINDGGSGKKFYKKKCVAVIFGGLAAGGPTRRGQKDYASRLGQVMLSGKAPMDHFLKVEICEADRGKIATPHDDPLVIELKVENLKVSRILVDTGSSSDIISLAYLNRFEHDPKTIEKILYPILGLEAA